MANQKDLVVKMTINSKEFDSQLQNSKSKMNSFEKDAKKSGDSFGNTMKSMGKAVAAFAVACKVFDEIKKGLTSTEQGADQAGAAMRQFDKIQGAVTQSLFHNIGSYNDFSTALANIAANAKAAYDALDNLGTFRMWGGAEKSLINAAIAEDRVIVNDGNASAADKKAAQGRIDANIKRLQQLGKQELEKTKDAEVAVLRELAWAGEEVTDEMLAGYVESWKKGTLADEAAQFRAAHSKVISHSYTVGNLEGVPAYEQEYYTDMWDDEANAAAYNAMKALSNAIEDEGGWKDYFDLIAQEGAVRQELASSIARANKVAQKDVGGKGGGSKTPKELSMTFEQEMEYWSKAFQNEIFANDREKDAIIIDIEIEDEQIEDDTVEIMEAVRKAREEMEQLVLTTQQAFTAADQLAGAFLTMGRISEGTLGNIFTMLGGVIQQVVQTMQAMMTLAGAETIEGVADLFANTPGDVFTKIAVAAAGLSGILGIIATAKSAFAGSFAEGGVVGGTSFTGDKLWARVNSGEMILNRNQQAALLNGGGNVNFVIEGSQLRGVLDNYDKTASL